MVKPDFLPFDLNHALLEGVVKKSVNVFMIVIATHEIHGFTANTLSIRRDVLEILIAKISQNPQDVTRLDSSVDVLEQN